MFLPEWSNLILSILDRTHDDYSAERASSVRAYSRQEGLPDVGSPRAPAVTSPEECGSVVTSNAPCGVYEALVREYPKRIRWASLMAVPLVTFPLSPPPPQAATFLDNPIHLLSQDWQRFLSRMFVCMRRAAHSATSHMAPPPVDFGGLLLWFVFLVRYFLLAAGRGHDLSFLVPF